MKQKNFIKLRFTLTLIGFLIISIFSFGQYQHDIDSLRNQLVYAQKDTNKLILLLTISNMYLASANYVDALPFCEQSLDLANELNAKRGAMIASNNLANCQMYSGDYTNALKNYLAAIEYLESKGENGKVADIYKRIASFHKDDYEKALEYYKKALGYNEAEGKKLEIAVTLWSMSGAYTRWCIKSLTKGDSINANNYYSESIKLIERALNLSRLENDSNGIAFYLYNLAGVYDKWSFCGREKILEQVNLIRFNYLMQSLNAYDESIKFYKLTGNKDGVVSVKYEIGNLYFYQGVIQESKGKISEAKKNYKTSLINHLDALAGVKQLGYEHGIANFSKSVGETYMRLGELKKSEKYLLDAERLFKKIKFKTGLLECYYSLSNLYEKRPDFKKALQYFKMYSILNDSLANEKSINERDLIISRFEVKRSIAENALLKSENALKEFNIKQQKFLFYAVIFIAILIILILVTTIMLARSRQKGKIIELNKNLIQVQKEALNAQINDHFIGNTMDSINNFINNNDKDKASKYLLLFSRLVRQVLENSSQKVVSLKDDLDVLNKYFILEKLRFKDENLNIEVNIDDRIDSENTMIPPMILQTLVENSIKHGFKKMEGGTIKVNIRENGNGLECVVEDNGIGRNASILARLDERDERRSYGSGLAERLATVSSGSYTVTDLVDGEGKPIGTRTSLKFPMISL